MTIAEIAARAGVSKTAVSRYLNDGYVSAEKRAVIRRVIEETGYVPSRQAQQMRSGRTQLIGVILPRIDSESISRVVRGISHGLIGSPFQLLLADTENDERRELEYLDVFRKGRVDGVLLIATMMTPAHRAAIRNCAVPLVCIGQHSDDCPCVYHDDEAAAFALTKKLLDAGRRTLAYIGVTPRDRAVGLARRQGMRRALEAAGLEWDAARCEQTGFSLDGGREACARLLRRGVAFDGLFCATDSIAVGAMQALAGAGRRVPRDVAVVGVGDSRLASLVRPTLTTAHYHYEKSGEEAARILLDILNGGEPAGQQIRLGFSIVDHESTGGGVERRKNKENP